MKNSHQSSKHSLISSQNNKGIQHKPMRFNIQPQRNKLPKEHTFFTHYSNSIYMGQMKAFKRQGKGILLHDNGLSGIVNSTHNSFRGHNVLFGQNSIISINFISQDCEIVYKNGKSILVCKLKRVNRQMVIDGIGYLIEFDLKRVYKIVYSNDQLLQKILLDFEIGKQIFQDNNLSVVMKQPHISALQMVFQTHPHIKINRQRDQIRIGFRKKYEISTYLSTYKAQFGQYLNSYSEDSPLEGVGVVLKIINYQPDKPFQLQFKIKQRGIYENGKLQFFGQKYFPNGNFYYGQIKDQKMHGMGLIFQKKQNKWMPGIFQDDRFVQSNQIESSLEKQNINNFYYIIDESDKKKLQKFYKQLHSQYPKIWIDQNINSLPSQQYLLQLLNILKFQVFTSTQTEKKKKKIQKSLKLQKLLIDVSSSQQDRSSPKQSRFNNNFNNQQIQQISNNLINTNNYNQLHLQNSLKPIIQQQEVNPGMEASFGAKRHQLNNHRLIQKINRDNQQLQREYTSPSQQQTIINQIRSSQKNHQEKNSLGLLDKKIIDFNKFTHQDQQNEMQGSYKKNNERVSWFIPSGDFQTKHNKQQHKSRSKSSEKNRSSHSSYKDSLEKLKQKNIQQRLLQSLSNKKYIQNPLGVQPYRKLKQNPFQKQIMLTPPKQSRRSKSPIRGPQRNEILANTNPIYHTPPVGKLYNRSNTNHNFNSYNSHKQDELNNYEQHLEAMNLLAQRLSKQKQRHQHLTTNEILINHLIVDENIKKYNHKTHKKHFTYLDAKDQQNIREVSPYRHSRRSRQKSPYLIQQRTRTYNQDHNNFARTSTSPYKHSVNTPHIQHRQKLQYASPYSQKRYINHLQKSASNNNPIVFDSTKQQNTPLKDLGKLIVKTQIQKHQKDKLQNQKRFLAKMKLKEQDEKSHFIKDNAIFWTDKKKK